MKKMIQGIAVSRGIAIGRAVLFGADNLDVKRYLIVPPLIPQEIERLQQGLNQAVGELQAVQASLPAAEPASAELLALLDVHLMLLQDETLKQSVQGWIVQRHYNAEWALVKHYETLVQEFDRMDDPYLRERKADLAQLMGRVLRFMKQSSPSSKDAAKPAVPDATGAARDETPLIVVAHDLAPADMLHFRHGTFAGFVTEVGGSTSHTAIVARSMDIPAVVGARKAIESIRADDWLVVEAGTGRVIVAPDAAELASYRQQQQHEQQVRERQSQLQHTPAVTRDGEKISLQANIELPTDTVAALEHGADGIGLFRSEFLFMGRTGDLPDEEEQYQAYRQAVEGMGGLPVTIRTVDIGADKPLGKGRQGALQPSALGLRAIRWSLAEPVMFRAQLRALLRAACHGPVNILIPMLAQQAEIEQVLAQLEQARQELRDTGVAFGPIQLGAMIEVPAAALMIDQFLDVFDFVSIGTNDLTQYTLAIDRADESVAHLFDALHPAVLRLIAHVIDRCRQRGKKVSVCGEMAGEPAITHLLLGMGLRIFSSHPAQILAVKEQVLCADTRALQTWAQEVLASNDPRRLMPVR
nr:phosphoenolpyruvate--protein phosphotransferase [Lampropedia hyalina]